MELMLTTQFFMYAERIWGGIPAEKSEDLGWYIKRKRLSYVSLLDSMLSRPGFFTGHTPVYPQYDSLKKWLQYYRSIEPVAPWQPIVADRPKYEIGDTSRIMAEIRKRLFWLKELPPSDTAGNRFDSSLMNAIKVFQRTHGLEPNGQISAQTLDHLNIPLQMRIEKIVVNLERSRWVPAHPRGEYITVNIPEFIMRAYAADTLAWESRVVVGKSSTQTVIFNGDLKYVVMAPYWNIPSSIIAHEILPACQRNPGYINSHNMEVVGASGKAINPSAVNWSSYTGRNFPYIIRQKPGPRNSLGLVKFLFPNEYNIYLHDTPSKSLFDEEQRSFSHGCIRVSEPFKLAQWLLRNDSAWPPEKIKATMNGGKETYVTLNKTVPVFIGYFTCFVTQDGKLNLRDDIYGRDKRLANKLFTDSAL
jgi:murein L,D-transpeptidase YcbB/YkuD